MQRVCQTLMWAICRHFDARGLTNVIHLGQSGTLRSHPCAAERNARLSCRFVRIFQRELLLLLQHPKYIWSHSRTKQEFEQVLGKCRELYRKKLQDYGCSWRIMRPSSITDQLYIKARRIRTLENGEAALIDEGIPSELMALVNYSIIGLIQLKLGPAEQADLDNETALALTTNLPLRRWNSCSTKTTTTARLGEECARVRTRTLS